jgi:hypothetical protein
MRRTGTISPVGGSRTGLLITGLRYTWICFPKKGYKKLYIELDQSSRGTPTRQVLPPPLPDFDVLVPSS